MKFTMPPFERRHSDLQQLDWHLFQRGPIVAYKNLSTLSKDIDWLKDKGYKVIQFSCQTWSTESKMHADLKENLDFPTYYGANLDALRECLASVTDTSWGYILVLLNFDDFWKRHRQTAWHLLDIIADASRRQLLFGTRLLALLQTAHHLDFGPFGAQHAVLNQKEWLEEAGHAREVRTG